MVRFAALEMLDAFCKGLDYVAESKHVCLAEVKKMFCVMRFSHVTVSTVCKAPQSLGAITSPPRLLHTVVALEEHQRACVHRACQRVF